jgi:hypothetical protein
MAITVTPQSINDSAILEQQDIQNIFNALSSVITLPSGKTWADVYSININITSPQDLSGSISITTNA